MSSTRRVVRATPRFFEDLDRQLRPERGPYGEPSKNDFQVFELIRIVDRFAVEFDDSSRLIAERDDYRILVMSGTLLAGFSVIGQLAADGAVELVQLDLDTELDWENIAPRHPTGGRCQAARLSRCAQAVCSS